MGHDWKQLAWIGSLLLPACYAAVDEYEEPSGQDHGKQSTSSGVGETLPSGMPCEVVNFLSAHCTSCHSDPPNGAPVPLLSREQLQQPSKSKPDVTVGERVLQRLRDTTAPMPPGGNLPESEIAVFADWAAAGFPEGSCDAPINPGPDPAFQGGITCVSGIYWPEGKEKFSYYEKESMNPGEACNACHATERTKGEEDAPVLHVAGTVYPSGHDDRLCCGVDGGAMDVSVVITGSDGKVLTLYPNATGNFFSKDTPVAKPYRAKVVTAKGERAMQQAVSEADCNSCHTPTGHAGDGKLAPPGRITVPW